MSALLGGIAFIVLAPLLGGLLGGLDRIVTARMQGRYGPPVLQPFYDVLKLFEKENLMVNRFHSYYLVCYLVFLITSGVMFFAGGDLLMVIFALTLADIMLVTGAYSTNSPYSFVGATRELLQMLAAEPMLLIGAVCMYEATNSFAVSDIVRSGRPLIVYLPGAFLGLVYVLTIKLRKSPFDLSTSHHAHQELVKGLTTEFAGPSLALVEIAHWYETILLLGIIYLFFSFNPVVGVAAALLTYFAEVLIDNTNARFRWQLTVKSAWVVSATFGGINLIVLSMLLRR